MNGGVLYPIAYLDPPLLLDTGVTNIPGSGGSFLQVIADTGPVAAYAIHCRDSSGDHIGVYLGAPGQEKFACIVGGGFSDMSWVTIPPHSRISFKSLITTAITEGRLSITLLNFYGKYGGVL